MYTYSALNQYTVSKILTTHDYNDNIFFIKTFAMPCLVRSCAPAYRVYADDTNLTPLHKYITWPCTVDKTITAELTVDMGRFQTISTHFLSDIVINQILYRNHALSQRT